MRTEVKDKARIFARELDGENGKYISYSTSMGKKKQDGSWENGRLFVEFQNGTPIPDIKEDGTEIDIKEGWMTFRNYQPKSNGEPMFDKNGKPVQRTLWGIHIKEWEYVGEKPKANVPLPDSFQTLEDEMPM